MKLLIALAIAAASLLPASASAAVLFYKQSCCIGEMLPLTLDTPTQPFARGLLEFVDFDGTYANLRAPKSFAGYESTGVGVFYGDAPIYGNAGLILNQVSWQLIYGLNACTELHLLAVPEPATWLMMLGCLVLVGVHRYAAQVRMS